MSKQDSLETINRGHEELLKKLEAVEKSHSSYLYWLNKAASNLCVSLRNVKLHGKLTYVDQLVKTVKNGFDEMNHLSDDLSDEEKEELEYCQARLKQICEEKTNENETDEDETHSHLKPPSKESSGSIGDSVRDSSKDLKDTLGKGKSSNTCKEKCVQRNVEASEKAEALLKTPSVESYSECQPIFSEAPVQLTVETKTSKQPTKRKAELVSGHRPETRAWEKKKKESKTKCRQRVELVADSDL